MLDEKLPTFYSDPEMSYSPIRKALQLSIMTRRRYKWDLMCERSTVTSSKSFFNALYQIRPYFYGIEDQI